MLKAKFYFNLAIAFSFAIAMSGCYTQLAPRLSDEDSAQAPEEYVEGEEQYVEGEEQYYDENAEYQDERDVDVYIYGGYPVHSYYYYDDPFWDPYWSFGYHSRWDYYRYRPFRSGLYLSFGYDPFYSYPFSGWPY